MKLRDSLIAMTLGAAVIGSGLITSGSALAQGRDYDERCGNCGTVTSVEQVKHKDSHVGAGTAIGAIAGGVLGSTIGKGDGRTAATVGGAIGHQVEKNNRGADYAWRFGVRMDNGRYVTVMQGDSADVREGDRVRVYNGRLERY